MYYDHATLEPAVEMFKSKQYASLLFFQTSTLNASLQRTAIKLERPLQRRDPDKKKRFCLPKKVKTNSNDDTPMPKVRFVWQRHLIRNNSFFLPGYRMLTIRMLTKTFAYALIFSTYISERNHFSLTCNFLDNDND